MPQSPFIQVPLKRTDDLDWASPLKRYIADVYQEDPDDYAPECATFHQLRNDMRGAGPDSTGLDILYKYYRQLELLDLRFPVDEKDGHVKVHFNWYDAFTGRATAQHSLAYEKACVIFNIAATLTAMASGQTRSEVDGLKRAYRYLQCAAGVFNFINDNFLHAPSADLSRESVKVLSQLTLAQAQECMLEKSLGEKKKPGLIAKIAAHAAEEYAKIADQFGELEKKGWIDKAWLKLVQVKASYFNALAQYNKGLAVEAEVNHGEALARYTVAEQAAKEASRTVREFSTVSTNTPLIPHDAAASLAEITKSNQSVVSEKKAKQTHDNDMIYHAVVPNTNTLQSMEKQPLTAPVSLTELYSTAEAQKVVGVDVFHRLIPLSVHQSASVYSEETAKLLRAEQEKSDIADAEAAAALEYMRLPGALDKFRDEDAGRVGSGGVQALAEPPANVREAALVVAQAEAQVPMADLVGALDRLRAEAYRMLDEVRQSLDQEQRECESLRVKYNELWDQGPSGPLTTSIRQDFRRHGEAMDRAMSADKSTLGRWEAIRGDVDLMSRGPEALDRAYAEVIAAAISAVRSAGSDVKPAVSLLDFDVSIEDTMASKIAKVEECMGKLNRLKKDRLDTLKDLRTLVHQDDISQVLVLNRNSNVESQIFQSALEKFRPHQTRLAAAAHHQQALIQELTKAYKALLQQEEGRRLQLEWDTAERRRSEFAEQLKVSAGTYESVKASVNQAVLFYNNITDLIRAVSRTAREFVNRRAEERNALVNTLETRRSEREQQMLNERLSRLTSPLAPSAPPQPPAQAPPTPPGLARGFGLPSAPVGDEYGVGRLTDKTGNMRISTEPTSQYPYASPSPSAFSGQPLCASAISPSPLPPASGPSGPSYAPGQTQQQHLPPLAPAAGYRPSAAYNSPGYPVPYQQPPPHAQSYVPHQQPPQHQAMQQQQTLNGQASHLHNFQQYTPPEIVPSQNLTPTAHPASMTGGGIPSSAGPYWGHPSYTPSHAGALPPSSSHQQPPHQSGPRPPAAPHYAQQPTPSGHHTHPRIPPVSPVPGAPHYAQPAPPSSQPNACFTPAPGATQSHLGPQPAPSSGDQWGGHLEPVPWGTHAAPAPYNNQTQPAQQYYDYTVASSFPPPVQPPSHPQQGGFPPMSLPYEHRPLQPPMDSYQHYPPASVPRRAAPPPASHSPGLGPPPVPAPPPRPPYPGVGGDNGSSLL